MIPLINLVDDRNFIDNNVEPTAEARPRFNRRHGQFYVPSDPVSNRMMVKYLLLTTILNFETAALFFRQFKVALHNRASEAMAHYGDPLTGAVAVTMEFHISEGQHDKG